MIVNYRKQLELHKGLLSLSIQSSPPISLFGYSVVAVSDICLALLR